MAAGISPGLVAGISHTCVFTSGCDWVTSFGMHQFLTFANSGLDFDRNSHGQLFWQNQS